VSEVVPAEVDLRERLPVRHSLAAASSRCLVDLKKSGGLPGPWGSNDNEFIECRQQGSDSLCIELAFGTAGGYSQVQRDRVTWPTGRSFETR
jgi:hypothetical protein